MIPPDEMKNHEVGTAACDDFAQQQTYIHAIYIDILQSCKAERQRQADVKLSKAIKSTSDKGTKWSTNSQTKE